jgi:hypothetical protein
MRLFAFKKYLLFMMGIFMLLTPAMGHGQQPEQAKAVPVPIEQKMVREGTLATKLEMALDIGTGEDEIAAESRLSEAGILPRNGWMADYPVTPDIIGELYKSVRDAADSGKISMNVNEALKKMDEVVNESGLGVNPYPAGKTGGAKPAVSDNYPNPTVINNYYYEQGPPVVTYYTPPPDFYYMYSWVPYPFWYSGFWFSGFFILHDFHRTVFIDNRLFFVSNHFNDIRRNRVFRVDPVTRFNGRTFAGIGVTNTRGFISTGVSRSERTIFNAPRMRGMPSGRSLNLPAAGGSRGRAIGPATRGESGNIERGMRR